MYGRGNFSWHIWTEYCVLCPEAYMENPSKHVQPSCSWITTNTIYLNKEQGKVKFLYVELIIEQFHLQQLCGLRDVCLSIHWRVSWSIQTKISQQLFQRLLWDVAQTFMVSRWWILMVKYKYRFILHLWSSPSLPFSTCPPEALRLSHLTHIQPLPLAPAVTGCIQMSALWTCALSPCGRPTPLDTFTCCPDFLSEACTTKQDLV